MNIEGLKLFCDVVRLQSFSEAALQNDVTQAAASQNISQLEKRLGVRLLNRTTRPFQLTEEGLVYYNGCREIVERYYAIENEAKTLRGEVKGSVRVAAIYSAGLGDISRCVQQFHKQYPEASVRLAFLHPHRVYESVLNDEAELGLISYPKPRRELEALPWRNEPMVVVCCAGHRFTRLPRLTFADLAQEGFIGFDPDLTIRREIDRYLRRHDTEVRVTMSFDNVETIKRAVELGEGVSILPQPTISTEIKAGLLTALALPKPGLSRPLAIIFRKNRVLARAAQRFIELIQRGAGEELQKKAA
jgi:DNA-binding transcriptional LysR family regulator